MDEITITAKPPSPSGTPWALTPEDPATVPVPIPIIIVSVEGPYTAQDRKLWAFLLHAVWDELGEKVIHELPIRDINTIFRQLGGRHESDWIWESADRLAGTKARWIRTEGDKRYRGVDNLLGAETDEEAKEEGILRFNFPPLLVPILKDPRRFSRLRTHFMIELSGKYAVTLYQLLESAANKDHPELEASVDELRMWLKVPSGKMLRWQDFRRKILDKTVEQINDNPEGAGFTVKYVPIKENRAIKRVRFEVNKTDSRLEIEEKLKDHQLSLPFDGNSRISHKYDDSYSVMDDVTSVPKNNQNISIMKRLQDVGLSLRDAKKICDKQWDIIETVDYPQNIEFEYYIREKIDLLGRRQKQGKVQNSTGFLLKAIKQNYANPEFKEDEKRQAESRIYWEREKARLLKKQQLEEEEKRLRQTTAA